MRNKNEMTITVDRDDLLGVIKQNREKHKTDVQKARVGFELEAKELLQTHMAMLVAGKLEKVAVFLDGVKDHTRDYDRAIRMLEMHRSNLLEIEAGDFSRYVEDDWDWKEQWTTQNAKYLG